MLSLRNLRITFNILPLGRTASKPRTSSRALPYRIVWFPPAFVASTPPMLAEPSEEIDKGSKRPSSVAAFCAILRVTPASIVMVKSVWSIP